MECNKRRIETHSASNEREEALAAANEEASISRKRWKKSVTNRFVILLSRWRFLVKKRRTREREREWSRSSRQTQSLKMDFMLIISRWLANLTFIIHVEKRLTPVTSSWARQPLKRKNCNGDSTSTFQHGEKIMKDFLAVVKNGLVSLSLAFLNSIPSSCVIDTETVWYTQWSSQSSLRRTGSGHFPLSSSAAGLHREKLKSRWQ